MTKKKQLSLKKIKTFENEKEEEGPCLLLKSNSTAHIPLLPRAKEAKRIYANFDKDIAANMFGYRLSLNKMKVITMPDLADMSHKPLCKFVVDVVDSLTRDYVDLPNYYTKKLVRKGMQLEN